MPPIVDPVPRELRAELRQAVLRLRTTGPHRVFQPVVHLGRPTGPSLAYAVPSGPGADHAVRCDVLAGLLRRLDPIVDPLVWLTRPGELSLHDVDAAWLAAAGTAHAEAGLSLTMVVVTRHGWWDPRSDARQVWKRLRDRRSR